MDYSISLFFCLSCLYLYFLLKPRKSSKLPPGPKPWPVVGNLFQLSNDPHRSLARLAKVYGPLMSLKLGSRTTVVVTSVDIAREVFQKHDLAFSSRNVGEVAKILNHHECSIVWLPVSPKWRNLRKISSVYLFTKKHLDATELLRRRKLEELVDHVEECCRNGQAVDIGNAALTVSLNFLSSTFFSTDLASHGSGLSHEFKDNIWILLEAAGKPSLADYFPILARFDLLGVRRKNEPYVRKFFAIFDEIIQQRLSADHSGKEEDVLATLLKMSKEDDANLSLNDIKHLLIDLFVGGTDTTSGTVEWAMTELIRNPAKMAKAQAEMDEILGKDYAFVRESDIARLPYLQAIVKEALRLHPPGPFLIPHKANADVDLCGYVVPRNSQLLVNVWAMGRDPATWRDPTEFCPERFMEGGVDFKGQHFELLSFGTGRRICPGLPLAYRMLHLMLANLVYRFEWELENGMRGEDVDMTDKFGLTLQKGKPLLVVPVAR